MFGFLTQFDLDLPVWNNKTFAAKPMLVKKEGSIAQYRRWYSQFYSENSTKLQSESLDW